jgi:hypothetical protein
MKSMLKTRWALVATLMANGSIMGEANAAVVQLGGTGVSNFWPFSSGVLNDSSGNFGSGTNNRYQAVYDTSLFTGITGPIQINSISFISQFGGAQGYTNTSISLALSSSPRDAGSQSLTFSENVGADSVVVFDDAITLSTNSIGELATFNFATGFVFDPTLGLDLLLDILPKGDASGIFYGAHGDEISRSFSQTGTMLATRNDYFGLSAVISYESVGNGGASSIPEPAGVLSLGCLLAGGIMLRIREPRS